MFPSGEPWAWWERNTGKAGHVGRDTLDKSQGGLKELRGTETVSAEKTGNICYKAVIRTHAEHRAC